MKKSTAIVLGFVVLVVGSIFLDRHREAPQSSSGGELAQMLATMAVKDAKENNHVILDYTPESIENVEKILGGLHDQYTKNPSSVNANGLGSAYGAYIGELIRRSGLGAKWERDDPVAGEKS